MVLAIPLLAAPLACTAILGDFTVGGSAAVTDSGPVNDTAPTTDGPTDTTHLLDVIQVAAGRDHTCALRSTGEVFCWGDNTLGQLGTNAVTGGSATPVKVANVTGIRALAAGNNHTCAVDGNGTSGGKVFCWGSNSQGQLGSATAGDHNAIAQQLTDPTGVIALTGGTDYTCAFDSGGSVSCWGANASAQLGAPHDGTKHFTPVNVSIANGVQELSAATEVTCAVASGSPKATIECWGTPTHAQIPGTDAGPEFTPTTVTFGTTSAAHIASGISHECASDTGGAIYCWGSNDYGESGNGTTGAGITIPPMGVVNISGVAAVGAGENYTCALTVAKYGVSCWGRNSFGALGNAQPTTSDDPQPVPQDVAGLTGVGQISVGFRHACAVVKTAPTPGQPDTSSGPVSCWGDNQKGQLGDGTQGNQKSAPVQVLKPAS